MGGVKRETAQWWVAPIRIKPKKFQEIEISLLTIPSTCAIIDNVKRGTVPPKKSTGREPCESKGSKPYTSAVKPEHGAESEQFVSKVQTGTSNRTATQ